MTGEQPKLRHAIVGVGAGILSAHRPALALETVEVVGACDVNAEVGRARAEELGCPFFPDHQTLLAETRPDITVILTPHPFHAAIAIDALEAGSHVLVEKPMAVHVAEADAMIQAAEANGRLLAVNFQQRHRPEIRAAHQLIQSGQLGELQRVELVEPWMRPAAYYRSAGWRGTWRGEGGGVLLNQAPHGLDLLCHLAGMPRRVFSWNRTLRHAIETEDTVLAMIEYDNGALGTIYFSTAEAGPRRMEIVGTGGRLFIAQDGSLTYQRFETDLREHIANHPSMFGAPRLEDVPVTLPEGRGDHVAVYRDLHRAILEGTPVCADGVQGRMSLELANAMIYSSYHNQTVELPLDREGYTALLESLKSQSLQKEAAR
ncbi:MAG: oxidoreductase [Litorilinea sp.]|nr:MAG: oxidoreductase [Litorilinea sp.]